MSGVIPEITRIVASKGEQMPSLGDLRVLLTAADEIGLSDDAAVTMVQGTDQRGETPTNWRVSIAERTGNER